MTRRAAAIAAASIAIVALTGCVQPSEEPAASPVPTETIPSTPLPTPTIGEEHAPPTSTDAASLDDAATTATTLLELFCRPGTEQQAWLEAMYPYLTERAGAAYETVDTRNIPCTTVTGAARLEDGANDFYAVAVIGTDAGDYRIELERADVADPWLAIRLQPAA